MRRKTKEQRRIFGHCLISVPPGRYLVRLTTTKCSMPRPLLKFAAFFSLLFAVRRPLKVANRNGRKRQLDSQRETRFRTKSPYPIAPSSDHKMKQQDNKFIIIFLKIRMGSSWRWRNRLQNLAQEAQPSNRYPLDILGISYISYIKR